MMSYNGWSNYETWNLPLWIDNHEGTYRHRREYFRRTLITAASVEAFCRELYPNGTPDMEPGDMQKVDWAEIAEAWKDELQ